LATGRELHAFTGHTESIRSLSLSGDGSTLASSSWDGTVRIWDAMTGESRAVIRSEYEKVHAVAFSNAARSLAPSKNGASSATSATKSA
jgi:WD40 repeat protein